MVIRLVVSRAAVGLIALGLGAAVSGEAFAQANVLKECGSRYQAKKAANELAGQSWQEFLKECRTSLSEQKEAAPAAAPDAAAPAPAPETKPAEAAPPAQPPAAAETPAPAPAPVTEAKPEVKDTKAATQARQKKCAAEWKAKKAELTKADKKMTWPKFWSACNKRLKDAGE
jgi:hypothetical protein